MSLVKSSLYKNLFVFWKFNEDKYTKLAFLARK